MEVKEKVFWMFIGVVALILVGLGVSRFITSTTGYTIQENNADSIALAQCLTAKGVKMFGLETCPHCVEQKKMFGEAFQYISYSGCEINKVECSRLQGVPAWVLGDKILYGTQSFSDLKKFSGC